MDPESRGINMALKNMSDFRELFFKDHAHCDSLFKISCTNSYLKLVLQAKNISANN